MRADGITKRLGTCRYMLELAVAAPYKWCTSNIPQSLGWRLPDKFLEWHLVSLIVAQFIGAMLGALIVWLFYKVHLIPRDTRSQKSDICTGSK